MKTKIKEGNKVIIGKGKVTYLVTSIMIRNDKVMWIELVGDNGRTRMLLDDSKLTISK